MRNTKFVYLFVFVSLILIMSCAPVKKADLRIALSSSTKNYENWIHRADASVITVDFDKMPVVPALKLLKSCDGLLLTGGEDVVPSRYGKPADSGRCETNPARDSLEFALIFRAIELRMPILGICRGQQILNVAMGGTLVVDIPSDRPSLITHRCEDYTKCYHYVTLNKSSELYLICRTDTGWVTSNHHQAVGKPAPGISVSALSADGIIEAIEYSNPAGKPFFEAVQWHPERMSSENPLSMPLMKAFLKSSAKKNQEKY
jgi:putative glutamine amidotransferase